MDEGIDPVRIFSNASRIASSDNSPKEDGILPVILLLLSLISDKDDKQPMVDGNDPVR